MALEMVKVVFDVFDTKYGLTRILPFILGPTLALISPVLCGVCADDHFMGISGERPGGRERPSKFAEIDVAEMEHHDGITYDNDLEPVTVFSPTRAGWKQGKTSTYESDR